MTFSFAKQAKRKSQRCGSMATIVTSSRCSFVNCAICGRHRVHPDAPRSSLRSAQRMGLTDCGAPFGSGIQVTAGGHVLVAKPEPRSIRTIVS